MFYVFELIVVVLFIDAWFTLSLASESLFNLSLELFGYKPGSFAGFLLFDVTVCCTLLPRLEGHPFSRRLASSKSLYRGAEARQWIRLRPPLTSCLALDKWWRLSYFFIKHNGSIYRELVGRLRKEDCIQN